MTRNMDFMKKVALLTSAWKSRGVAWSYNFEDSWNMLGGVWISNIIFISFLEQKGGPKEKKSGAHTPSWNNHLQMMIFDDFSKVF